MWNVEEVTSSLQKIQRVLKCFLPSFAASVPLLPVANENTGETCKSNTPVTQ